MFSVYIKSRIMDTEGPSSQFNVLIEKSREAVKNIQLSIKNTLLAFASSKKEISKRFIGYNLK